MPTTAHSGLTGANLHEPKGVAAAVSGTVYVANGAASGAWARLVPLGIISPYGGTTAPSLWLLCYGQAVSRTTYTDLYAIAGTTYGAGDGSTTFNIPDLRGRAVAGQDDMGGTSANRLTGITGGINGDTLGLAGGEEAHTMTTAELAAHVHGGNYYAATTYGVSGGGAQVLNNQGTTNTSTTGSSTPFNVVQPTLILNYIIFAGV